MKQNNLLKVLLCLFVMASFTATAQLNTPRGSQMASVSQTVGITKIYVEYSRPSVNGREIWGNLVPYGMNNLGFGTAVESPWRAGANENTVIKFTDDVTIGGKNVKAGKYGFHVIVNENDTATIIMSHNHGAWGSYFYDPSEDALRVDVTTETIPHTEQLTYHFVDVTPNSATVALDWEKKRIPMKVEVDVTNIVMADIRQKLQNQEGFNRQTWEQAAAYSMNNGGDLDEALGWIDGAIEGQFFSQKNFNNLSVKAQILNMQGKSSESDAIMNEALDIATVFETHQYGRTLIGQGKKEKALEVFKLNASKFKNTWPTDYGLARGYSATGNYSKALEHMKIALERVPDAQNKNAILTNITKLEKGEDIN